MNTKRKSVLVTGGAGFIASHLCEILVRRGDHVTVVDNLTNGSMKNLQYISSQIDFHELDTLDPVFQVLVQSGNFDVIFHLAANAYVPPSVDNPTFDFRNNLLATFQLLETLRCIRVKPIFIVASSAAVYGDPIRIPIIETDPLLPISPYGVGKLAIERYVSVFSQLYGLKAASLRLFSVYGPRQRKQIVFDLIHKLACNPNDLEILGDGTQVRDMIYVEDVARAALTVLERAPLIGEVYNVATGQAHLTREIVESISKCMQLSPNYHYTGNVRPGDPNKWEANIDRLSSLGFVPQVSLDEGIKRTVQWYQSQQ